MVVFRTQGLGAFVQIFFHLKLASSGKGSVEGLEMTLVTVTETGNGIMTVREVSGERPGHFPALNVYKVYKVYKVYTGHPGQG